MGIALFTLSAALALLTGLFFNAIFRHTSRVKFLLGWSVLIFASIILTAEICSLFSIINKSGFLLVQLLLGASGWGLWRLFKSPRLMGHLDWQFQLPPFRENWLLYVFSLVCLAAYLFNAVLIVRLPPNNFDSMTYHLARVGYWMQNETLFPWDTSNYRQTAFPLNAEIGLLWSMLFLRSDILTGFLQWFSAWTNFLAIYGLGLVFGGSRKQAWFAGLVWLTLPQIVLQSTTTQNDLVVSSLFVIAIYFLLEGWKSSNMGELALSGVALGLALGTKLTAGMAVPGLGILCLVLWIKSRRPRQFFFTLASSYILGFLIFGSLGYIQNLVYYGTILGPKDYSDAAMGVLQTGKRIILQNALVYAYQFLDPAGLPPEMASGLLEIKAKLAAPVFETLGLRANYLTASVNQVLHYPLHLHEDFTWFGPLSFLAIIPGIVAFLWRSVKNKKNFLGWGAILVAVLFIGVLILQGWSPHRSRYIVLPVALLVLFTYYLYNDRRPIYAVILAGIGCFVMWNTMLHNEAKPLIGPNAIWGKDSLAVRTINNPQIEPLLRASDAAIPPDAELAIKLGSNGWDYVFFGKGFGRTLIQLNPKIYSSIDQQVGTTSIPDSAQVSIKNILEYLGQIDAEYIVIGPQQEFFLKVPPGLDPVIEQKNGNIYKIIPQDFGKPIPEVNILLPGTDETGILEVAHDIAREIGVMEVWTGSWSIEQNQEDAFLWLGQGEAQGFGARLWAEEGQPVCINLVLLPGPSREDSSRTISFVYFDENDQRVTRFAGFDTLSVISFETPLHPGVNSFGFSIVEPATILKLPNGDERNLLARLEQIEVTTSEGTCP